jgi:ferredoxin
MTPPPPTDGPTGAGATAGGAPTNRMNPTELMREAERVMERNARARAVREERALDSNGLSQNDDDDDVVVRGATKPGEDDWAMTTTNRDGVMMMMMRSGRSGGVGSSIGMGDDEEDADADVFLEEEQVEIAEAERQRVFVVEEEFKRGKAALRRRDAKEALARFEAAARACPPESVEVREKLSRTIAQIRELAADEDVGYGDADAIKDEIAASVRDGDDDVEEERATTPSTQGGDDFFERDAAVSDAGWSEGQSLADDAYRTALWLIESAGEDGPQDVDEIVDLLERARRLCPESRPDAVARIDALLASMRLQS